jgi:ferric-dicitrate binding protein FerR (iron transport regulator)
MEQVHDITLLLLQELSQPLSEADQLVLNNWLAEHADNVRLRDRLHTAPIKDDFDILSQYDAAKGLNRLEANLDGRDLRASTHKGFAWWRMTVAAAIVVLAGMGVYRLANKTGTPTQSVFYKTVTIPRGQQGVVQLPDSTRVWMNAASTLRYPVPFSDTQRTVELNGEAFFDVTKLNGQRFVVKLQDMAITVRGTRFNVKGYAGESYRTTLLEGKVEVVNRQSVVVNRQSAIGNQNGSAVKQHSVILQPGEQASLNPLTGNLTVRQVDTTVVKSWTTGRTIFHESLPTLLKELERRYDITTVFNPHDLMGLDSIGGVFPNTSELTLAEAVQVVDVYYPTLDFRVNGKELVIEKRRKKK